MTRPDLSKPNPPRRDRTGTVISVVLAIVLIALVVAVVVF